MEGDGCVGRNGYNGWLLSAIYTIHLSIITMSPFSVLVAAFFAAAIVATSVAEGVVSILSISWEHQYRMRYNHRYTVSVRFAITSGG